MNRKGNVFNFSLDVIMKLDWFSLNITILVVSNDS